jgi:membrane-associated phospholipid phosphatase
MPKVRHWLVIALVLFAVAIGMGLVAAHTGLTAPHELAFNAHVQKLRHPGLNTAFIDLADVASPVGGLAIIAVITLFLLVRRNPVQAVATFLVIAVGWNVSEVAKLIVARNRPPVRFSLQPEIGSNSFPSGHTAFAFSLAVAAAMLAYGTRWFVLTVVVGTVWTLSVGFSRLYIGAHYPLDVVGSILVSSAAIVLLTGLWHGWIRDNLYRIPLLAKFGELPSPVPSTPVAAGEAL